MTPAARETRRARGPAASQTAPEADATPAKSKPRPRRASPTAPTERTRGAVCNSRCGRAAGCYRARPSRRRLRRRSRRRRRRRRRRRPRSRHHSAPWLGAGDYSAATMMICKATPLFSSQPSLSRSRSTAPGWRSARRRRTARAARRSAAAFAFLNTTRTRRVGSKWEMISSATASSTGLERKWGCRTTARCWRSPRRRTASRTWASCASTKRLRTRGVKSRRT